MDPGRVEPPRQVVRLLGRAPVLPDQERRDWPPTPVHREQAVPEAADPDRVDPLASAYALVDRPRRVDDEVGVELRQPAAPVRDLVGGLRLLTGNRPAELVERDRPYRRGADVESE